MQIAFPFLLNNNRSMNLLYKTKSSTGFYPPQHALQRELLNYRDYLTRNLRKQTSHPKIYLEISKAIIIDFNRFQPRDCRNKKIIIRDRNRGNYRGGLGKRCSQLWPLYSRYKNTTVIFRNRIYRR